MKKQLLFLTTVLLLCTASAMSQSYAGALSDKFEPLSEKNLKEIPQRQNQGSGRDPITVLPFFDDFEDPSCWDTWTIYNASDTIDGTFVNLVTHYSGGTLAYDGSHAVCFSSYFQSQYYDQYIVSDLIDLPGNEDSLKVSFYYRKYMYGEEEHFRGGYSLNEEFQLEDCIWGDSMVATSEEYQLFEMTLPPNTKHFVVHYYSNYSYYLFVDALTIDYKNGGETPCLPPENLTVLYNETSEHVDLEWNPAPDAVTYLVFRTGIYGPIAEVTGTQYTDTIPLTLNETCYSIRTVCAEDPSSMSGDSEEACVALPEPTECPVPKNLVADAVTGNTINLQWEDPSDGNTYQYKVYRDNMEIATVSQTSYSDVNLDNGTYTYLVKTVCDGGVLSDPSNEAVETVSILEWNEQFRIYPNPASDKIFISGEQVEGVSLYNLVGQFLGSFSAVENVDTEIDLRHLEGGVYLIRIATRDGKVTSKRIVITK